MGADPSYLRLTHLPAHQIANSADAAIPHGQKRKDNCEKHAHTDLDPQPLPKYVEHSSTGSQAFLSEVAPNLIFRGPFVNFLKNAADD